VQYVALQELGAANHDLNASDSARRAKGNARRRRRSPNKRTQSRRAKEYDAMLDAGYWECEDGDEMQSHVDDHPNRDGCIRCGKPAKFVKRSEMSGQDLYESEKEQKEAAAIAADNRAKAAALEGQADEGDRAAAVFCRQA
jgi:hypothetical protein